MRTSCSAAPIRRFRASCHPIFRSAATIPLRWKPDEPAFEGIDWVVKNLLELKNARNVVIDGNVFEHNWADDQNGFAILFTPRN